MVIDRDIRQRNALFDLGSLADIRQLQIALGESDLTKRGKAETKKKRLKHGCFHILAVTLPRFSILRYQIIRGYLKPPIDPLKNRARVAARKTQELLRPRRANRPRTS